MLPASGFTMYHAMPARCGPASGLSAVSSAPHTLPLAYITCCMRVSFESGLEMTSLCAGSAPKSSRQQPNWPLNSCVVVSLMQSPCATSGVVFLSASVPGPGCCCFGGTPYWPTVRILLLIPIAAVAVFSDAVFVSVHATSWLEVRVPAVPETGFCASSAAFELSMYSVPLFARLNCDVPGDCAGQTVKPGWVEPASLGALTMPEVSMCCIVTLAAPAASWAFESA